MALVALIVMMFGRAKPGEDNAVPQVRRSHPARGADRHVREGIRVCTDCRNFRFR